MHKALPCFMFLMFLFLLFSFFLFSCFRVAALASGFSLLTSGWSFWHTIVRRHLTGMAPGRRSTRHQSTLNKGKSTFVDQGVSPESTSLSATTTWLSRQTADKKRCIIQTTAPLRDERSSSIVKPLSLFPSSSFDLLDIQILPLSWMSFAHRSICMLSKKKACTKLTHSEQKDRVRCVGVSFPRARVVLLLTATKRRQHNGGARNVCQSTSASFLRLKMLVLWAFSFRIVSIIISWLNMSSTSTPAISRKI